MKRKHKVTVYLKSGAEITFKCNTWEFKTKGGKFISYTLTGLKKSIQFDPSELIAYREH